jgi:uncharacterized protein YprB with RNaseH-like and TPR domain
MSEKQYCIHRQPIENHPNCFKKGLIKGLIPQAVEENKRIPWFIRNKDEIGYLDIETDGLTVDFSTMLSWCIKRKDGGVSWDVISKQELFNLEFDERLVRSCVAELKRYKIIVTYFGTRFDNSFLRAKCLHYGIDFPGYVDEVVVTKTGREIYKANAELYHFDLFYLVKSKLGSLSRKSLDNVCDYLNIEGKTPLRKSTWRKAKYGDPTSIAEVLEHNIGDVKILEELHNKLYPFSKWIKNPL